jgi:alpha-mannosidase
VDEVLDTLEADESFRSFTLDGQAIVLEDYADVRPENVDRLRTLLSAGRLEAGPWYVLPDEVLVGGESLVRNLLLGRRVCRRFGVEPTAAGYEPDSFGHPAQLPQILAGFGLRTFLFSRGLGDQIDDVGLAFRWRAAGAEVVACQFLPHYDNFARLTTTGEAAERVAEIVERFHPTGTVVLANGSDHLHIQPQLPELLRELGPSYRIGRFSDFQPPADGLPAYEGELVGSRLQNVLRGVNSARMYLKQADERAERRLIGTETVTALRSLREGTPFPHADVGVAWRDLLRNHPHDSICGCSCDEVHRDMLVRYEQLDRTLEIVEREALGVGGALVNPLPYRRSCAVGDGVVELGGFEGRRAQPQEQAELVPVDMDLVFEDEPDAGDLYTFCPDGEARQAELVRREERPDGSLLLEHELPGIRISTVARAVAGRIELRTTVDNDASDHRLRVRFPVAGAGEWVRAESQFAVVRRPVTPPAPRAAWVEPPVAQAHTLGTVALGPLALLTKGLPEYEASPDALHLTLLRCVGTISRPAGLPTRPVAAGPDIATPDGQCHGRHVLEYAIRLDAEDMSDAALIRAGQDYRTGFLTGDPFPAPFTLEGDVVFSCLKGAEDGRGIVLRVFNPNDRPETLRLDGARADRLRLDEADAEGGGLELAPGAIATFRITLD